MTQRGSSVKACLISNLAGLSLFVWLVSPATIWAQRTAQSDPTAVALVKQALARLASGTEVRDVTIEASATYTAGSDVETGTATLEALGSRQSRLLLKLDGGQREELRRGLQGVWSGPDGQAHPISPHNAWTDASWFFPALCLQAILSEPQLVVVYAGEELRGSVTVHHLRFSRLPPEQDAPITSRIERLSGMDMFVDSVSLLPVALAFVTHPDRDAGMDIPVEIQFSDYRVVEGARVPFRVQKLLQGSLMLDLNVTRVAVNTGVPESEFIIPGAEL